MSSHREIRRLIESNEAMEWRKECGGLLLGSISRETESYMSIQKTTDMRLCCESGQVYNVCTVYPD